MTPPRRPNSSLLTPNSSLLTALCSLLTTLLPLSVFSGEILGGRLHTVPETVYVNQPFAIHFELETTFGSEISDLRISDFPNNPELITVGTLESVARDRVMRGTQHLEIHRFTAQARCHKPVEHTFTPTLHCTLSEQRRASGFFAQWNSRPHQKRLDPFTLHPSPSSALSSSIAPRTTISGAKSTATTRPGPSLGRRNGSNRPGPAPRSITRRPRTSPRRSSPRTTPASIASRSFS